MRRIALHASDVPEIPTHGLCLPLRLRSRMSFSVARPQQ
jgi:hypothetical protein